MRRIPFSITFLVILAACSQQPANDCAYSGGKPVKGMDVVVTTAPAGELTLRSVCFVNNGTKTVSIDAIETSPISVEGTEVWSFQPSSSEERKDWVLPVEKGFYQRNFLGMNAPDYGGGIPMVSLWNKDACVSVGLAEPVLRLVSLPVSRKGNTTRAVIRQEFSEPVQVAPGDTLFALKQFVIESKGDFFQPLRQFAGYMHDAYGWEAPVSPEDAYEPVWCAWGYERTFTVDEVVGTLPKVVELGFKWVDIDDGYQICEGDWTANDRIGAEGMRRMTDAVHEAGLKAKIWWAPMSADPGSALATEHPEMLLVQKDGSHEDISWWDSWYLSPVNVHTWKYTEDLVDMFLVDWGFDGFKLDGHYLNLCAPDYNLASALSYPEEASERLPEFFAHLYGQAQADKPGCVVQLCPCGCAVNFFSIPYMNQAVASDPTSSAQIRMKRMVYAAMCPDLAYYADHVELSDGGLDFASQVGVGGVIGTKFTWPRVNPDAQESGGSLLTPEKEALLRKWVPIYKDKMISRGTYLDLYTYGIDKPEAHVIEKDNALYYAFYAPQWNGAPITLRGLDASRTYTVTEYTADVPRTYLVDGSDPVITPVFENNYLIEVTACPQVAPEVKDGSTVLATNPLVEKFLTEVSYPDKTCTEYTKVLDYYGGFDGKNITWDNWATEWPDGDKPQSYSIRWQADDMEEGVMTLHLEDELSWTGDREIAAGSRYAIITNLVPNDKYSYKVTTESGKVLAQGSFSTTGRLHQVFFTGDVEYKDGVALKGSGARNARDLGGWNTLDGKTTKYRKIYRGGRLNEKWEPYPINAQGQQELLFEGIGAQLDLRGKSDVMTTPAAEGLAHCAPVIEQGGKAMLVNDHAKTKQCFEFVLDCVRKNKPVYFHCSLGRDRTGTLDILLLGLLGVREGDIAKEYEVTYFAPVGYSVSSSEKGMNTEPVFMNTRMEWVYSDVVPYFWEMAGDGTFADGVEKYLLTVAGVSQKDIDDFRRMMLN